MNARTAWVILVALTAPSAHAYTGTITGTITGVDARPNPYLAMGYTADPSGARQHPPRFASAVVPVREVLIHFRACNSVGICAEHWTLTSTSGVYSIPWTLASAPTSMLLEVWAQRPDISAGVVTSGSARPPHQFRIGTAAIPDTVLASALPPLPSGSGVTQTVNLLVASASEFLAAYLTAVETYAMLDAQHQPSSGSLRNDMDGVNVFAFQSYDANVFGGRSGVTPDSWQVWITPYTAMTIPSIPAHELGHILAYRSFDRISPVAQPHDYQNDLPFSSGAWSDFSDEWGKASFQEGLGILVEAMWLWTRSANPAAPSTDTFGLGTNPAVAGTGGPTSLELATQRPSGGVACANLLGARRAMCNARALWDVVDNPGGAGQDAITNRDLGDVVAVLRSFPHNCIWPNDNRCENESGSDDGVNWSDFRGRFETLFGQSLSSIESTNDLSASPDS